MLQEKKKYIVCTHIYYLHVCTYVQINLHVLKCFFFQFNQEKKNHYKLVKISECKDNLKNQTESFFFLVFLLIHAIN